jgi:hypothetical protein
LRSLQKIQPDFVEEAMAMERRKKNNLLIYFKITLSWTELLGLYPTYCVCMIGCETVLKFLEWDVSNKE